MKQNLVETKSSITLNLKQAASPPPSPPPPPKSILAIKPLFKRVSVSITNEEIAKFWRQRRMVEEDHFLAAIKAAARIRARNLSEEDYKYFEESLKEDGGPTKKDESDQEIRVGIKDWWTKSKYAYLNEPVIETNIKPKQRSTYIPNLCFYKLAYHPTNVSFGIC